MPVIPLKHVVSFSSEDKKFPSDNLLKAETYRKWKCKENGEKQVSVILQFDKSHKIHSVDIGNENSAFVEVLVGSSSDTNEDFKVLLPTSTFMNPSESKSCKNSNRVRMFDSEKLSKPVLSSKWDMVKIVCTQPFNKYIQYGISFITFHSPPEQDNENATRFSEDVKSTLKLGAFSLKPDDNQVSSATPGSLFFKAKKNLDSSQSPTGAAAIRQASIEAKNKDSLSMERDSPLSKTKNESLSKTNTKQPSSITADQNKYCPNITSGSPSGSKEKLKKENKSSMKSVKRSHSVNDEFETGASHLNTKTKKKKSTDKPFRKLMKKVGFVLSGFQNPLRSEIRDKALEMGASFCSDWNSSSTHLICAFKSTPKYNIVKSKGGRIVKKNWIEDCYQKQKLLPWRSYGLGSNSHVPDSSESSESELSTEEDVHSQNVEASDAEDTDDEILRVQEENKEKVSRSDTANLPLPELPDIFIDLKFYLFGEFLPSMAKNLHRIITSFGGEIENYMSDNVNFVVTESEWDSNFDDALASNLEVKFVNPSWISKCSQENKLVPPENFIINS